MMQQRSTIREDDMIVNTHKLYVDIVGVTSAPSQSLD